MTVFVELRGFSGSQDEASAVADFGLPLHFAPVKLAMC